MATTSAGRRKLTQISSDAFVSPLDRAALQNLQKLPLLPMLVRQFNELALDRMFYALNTAESIRCGPRQFPSLYALHREACAILDVPEPELYLRYDERYNGYTAGVQRTFIVLNSALVNDFTDEEILFVLGHELGHVKCGHVLYQMLGRMLLPLLDAIGQATLGVGRLAGMGLVSAFYEWLRQAEFTCDRAGLLACQDSRTAYTALMRLGGGSTRFDREMNVEAFLEQARTHQQAAGAEGLAKALLFVLYTWQLEHPQVVFRAKGLEDWIETGAYQRILAGRYDRVAASGQSGNGRGPEEPI